MIYIFTALYCEASFLIRQFHLVKNPTDTQFQEFHNEAAGICLTITGAGEIAAAAAVSSVCTRYQPMSADMLLNIGTCGRMAGADGIFLCNKIIEQATGKTFYPDILYRHGFLEETVITGMLPYNASNDAGHTALARGAVHDMEAAAIYQAGSYFFGPHQMVFVKLVSDNGVADGVSRERVEQLMEANSEVLCGFVSRLLQIASGNAHGKQKADETQEQLAERLCADMHCSKTMGDSLRQHIRYVSLAGGNVSAAIQDMYAEGRLPCKDKREGKMCFEELKRRLFE